MKRTVTLGIIIFACFFYGLGFLSGQAYNDAATKAETPTGTNLPAYQFLHSAFTGDVDGMYASYNPDVHSDNVNAALSYFPLPSGEVNQDGAYRKRVALMRQSDAAFYGQIASNIKNIDIIYIGGKQLPDYGEFLFETKAVSASGKVTDFLWIFFTDENGLVVDFK